jgi:hypothetical protein
MKTFTNQAHQGDVFLRRIDAIPATAKLVEHDNGRAVIALGETSGHHHSMFGRGVTLFRDDGAGSGAFYAKVDVAAALEHLTGNDTPTGEHASIMVPPGLYALPPQQQWTDADEPIAVED